MGIDLTAIASNTETTPFSYQGFASSVTYKPSELTTENIAKFGNVNSIEDMNSYLDFMAAVMVDWEVSEQGERMSISRGTLARVPLPMLGKIMEAIVANAGEVAPEADGNSAGGSFQE